MLQKPNLSFVTSVTLKIKVMTPNKKASSGACGYDIYTKYHFDSCKLFELLHGNKCLWTDRQTVP